MICKNDNKIHSGIYTIMCWKNGVSYPGRSKNILKRLKQHLKELKNNEHHCDYLQNAFNLYGENSFFTIICEDEIPYNQLKIKEQLYLDFGKQNKRFYFNSSFSAENTPELTIEVRKKLSETKKGKNNPNYKKVYSKEERKILSIRFMGENNPNFGKKHTLENLKIMSKPKSEEHKQKISNTRLKNETAKGKNNPRYDHTNYTFKNIITNETFTGTRYEFSIKFKNSISKGYIHELVRKKIKCAKNWIIVIN